jgi:hypothetical protein
MITKLEYLILIIYTAAHASLTFPAMLFFISLPSGEIRPPSVQLRFYLHRPVGPLHSIQPLGHPETGGAVAQQRCWHCTMRGQVGVATGR